MNKPYVLLLSVILLVSGCKPSLLSDTPENVMQSVLSVLQTNDVEGLRSLLLSPEEIEKWMVENDQPNIELMIKDVKGMYERLPNIIKLVRTVAEKQGIDWAACEVLGIENISKDNEAYTTMKLSFNSGGNKHSLTAELTQKTEGWRLVSAPQASWLDLE